MTRYLVPLVAFAILIPVLMIGLTRDPRELPSPLLQQAAPQFELPSLLDPARTVGSKDFANQMTLLNVWATWCPGCRQEHDFLLQLAREAVLPIYGLNWRDNRPEATRWLEVLGNPYVASAFDEEGRVGIDWGVYGAPETFLIDANGIVVHKHIAPLTREIWERDFVPLIRAAGVVQ
jgi:cytochrome c biogenesis protein CcmG/thiol:disulfide interchange protein DsbE